MDTFENKKLRKNLLKLKKQSKNLVQSGHQSVIKHGEVAPDSATPVDVLITAKPSKDSVFQNGFIIRKMFQFLLQTARTNTAQAKKHLLFPEKPSNRRLKHTNNIHPGNGFCFFPSPDIRDYVLRIKTSPAVTIS
jgi:hypothetical protein